MDTLVRKKDLNGTNFVEISCIRPNLGGVKEPESRLIIFACGSDKVLIRSRNHGQHIFTPGLDKVFTLSKPYECD